MFEQNKLTIFFYNTDRRVRHTVEHRGFHRSVMNHIFEYDNIAHYERLREYPATDEIA